MDGSKDGFWTQIRLTQRRWAWIRGAELAEICCKVMGSEMHFRLESNALGSEALAKEALARRLLVRKMLARDALARKAQIFVHEQVSEYGRRP